MLFKDEVENMEQLIDTLTSLEGLDALEQVKVAVVGFIFDKSGNLVLHRRGPGARDEIGKLQALGGSVNGGDGDFRNALIRELAVECGSEAKFDIQSFIGAQLDGKVDGHTHSYVNWIILGYKVNHISGELINNEPDRCVGFEKAPMANFDLTECSTTAANFIKEMLNK